MSAPLQPPSSADLAATLTRDWAVQVNTGTLASPVWEWVNGITGFESPVTKTRQEAGDINFGQWGGQISTEANWTATLNLLRKLDETGEPDPAVEFLRARALETGPAGMAEIRYWRTDGHPDSYQGRGDVEFAGAGGDKTSLFGSTCTIAGYGPLNAIPKPSATTVTKLVTITGSPTGGTFTLTVDTRVTTALNWNATAAQIQSALEALTTVGEDNVTVTGSAGGPFTVVFNLAVTNVTATATLTGGSTPGVTVANP